MQNNIIEEKLFDSGVKFIDYYKLVQFLISKKSVFFLAHDIEPACWSTYLPLPQ